MVIRNALRLLAVTIALFSSSHVDAQLFRAYLSIAGSDSNPCTLPAPCRLLPAALSAVADGGEVWLLDSANYNTGTVSVTKSVTILAVPGQVGSVVANGGAAIDINASGVKVTLRNLVLVPLPSPGATAGILAQGSNVVLTIDGCTISGMPVAGVATSNGTHVRVIDSLVRANGVGLLLGGSTRGVVSRTRVLDNTSHGIHVSGNVPSAFSQVEVADSVISGNGGEGVLADTTSAGSVNVTLTRDVITHNNLNGVLASSSLGNSVVVVDGSNISYNGGYGMRQSGGSSAVASRGNNTLFYNLQGSTAGTISSYGAL